MKIVLAAACGLVAMTAVTFAQTTPTPSDPEQPAVGTRDATNQPAPVSGENSFTEEQARERIEEKGYAYVADLKLGEDGVWRARADKAGTAVEVALDFQGNVTEGAVE